MKTQPIIVALAVLQLLPSPLLHAQESSGPDNVLGQILRGLGQALTLKQNGGRQPTIRRGEGRSYEGLRVFNVVDPRSGADGFIQQGQVFQIVGQGFGRSEGRVVMQAEGGSEWITLRERCIQRWQDDSVTLVIPDSPFASRQTRVSVGVVSSSGRSDVITGIVFRSTEAAAYDSNRPTVPRSDYFDHYRGDEQRRDYASQIPLNPAWSVAARSAPMNETFRNTYAARTMKRLLEDAGRQPNNPNTRYWSGATVGAFIMGAPPSEGPWPHFVVTIATGVPYASKLAATLADAAVTGAPLRPGAGMPPQGGFPSLNVSREILTPARQFLASNSERDDDRIDAQFLTESLRLSMPEGVGALRFGRIDEIGREQWGAASGVVKCLSGEGNHVAVLAFLSRINEPVGGRSRGAWQCGRSVRVVVIANGPEGEDHCHRILGY